MSGEIKFCVDCKWGRDRFRCTHPRAARTDLVSGTKTQELCALMRYERHDICGREGKLWEPVA
jgi:hypothetical protein